MKFLVISTFNRDGLELYGKRMIESFHRRWPPGIPIRIYAEGWDKGEIDGDVQVLDLEENSMWLRDFKKRHKNRQFKDFRWDVVRWSHKVAAMCHAAWEDVDYLIWLDGDVYAHSDFSMSELEWFLPRNNEWIAWLDRTKMVTETGFYILNCRHPRHLDIVQAYEKMYMDDEILRLREHHDGFALQHVMLEFGDVAKKSLSGRARNTSHPMVNGELGRWFDHLKGSRKQEGRSRASDLVVERDEDYWK